MKLRHNILSSVFVGFQLFLSKPLLGAPQAAASDRAQLPNIIIMMVDDLGYGDLSCYGHEAIQTPQLDRLAAEGIRFTSFYASAAWCMPSRKALMTGIHPYRGGLSDTIEGRLLLPEVLQQAGYQTALIGKWHLGMDEARHPMSSGFDYFFGTGGSNDVPKPKGTQYEYSLFKEAGPTDFPIALFQGRKRVEFPMDQRKFTQYYTREVISFIEESAAEQEPFFIYYANNMPHVPIFASEAFRGKSEGGLYGDVVEELDWSAGEIIKTLKDKGLYENTIFIFTSDNGPWSMYQDLGGTANPLRGEKSTNWEGGGRVPAILSWPGKIEPRESDAFIVLHDLYRTMTTLAGVPLPEDLQLDSLDMSDLILNDEASPRQSHIFFTQINPGSIRVGDYKITFNSVERTRDPGFPGVEGTDARKYNPPLLFNLKTDPSESTDVASEHPERVENMTKLYREGLNDLETNTYR